MRMPQEDYVIDTRARRNLLEAVAKATAARRTADEKWRSAILAARLAGITGREVADAAGVTFARIYQIDATREETTP
jgi:hypothetical protein